MPPRTEKGNKKGFEYDEERDACVRPENHDLTRRGVSSDGSLRTHKMEGTTVCRKCVRFGERGKDKNGRKIGRLLKEASRQRFEDLYNSDLGRAIYPLRQQKVELPFGHIKRNLNADHFLPMGRKKVLAEVSLFGLAFNIRRMLTLLGGVVPFQRIMAEIG